jgi:hypothetical protein
MTTLTVQEAIDNIYQSLRQDNLDIDMHIDALKNSLSAEGLKEAIVDPVQLVQNNRQGRKLMQSYFRKRGVTIVFKGTDN